MPAFNIDVPHSLGKDTAVEKLKSFLGNVEEKFKDQISSIDGEWNDNVLSFNFTTYGFTISGTMTVEEEIARMEGQLPFAAMAFRGTIEDSIRKEVEKTLA